MFVTCVELLRQMAKVSSRSVTLGLHWSSHLAENPLTAAHLVKAVKLHVRRINIIRRICERDFIFSFFDFSRILYLII